MLPDTWHWTDNCITVFGKWIFDSNLKVALPLTQDSLNDICCGNDTDENKFIGILHVIIAVPPEVVQIILNMKSELSIIILRNGVHPRHMIYLGISLLIQPYVCY